MEVCMNHRMPETHKCANNFSKDPRAFMNKRLNPAYYDAEE
jgi:hypothetical protein